MAATTKLVGEVEVEVDCDLFYEVFKQNPNNSAVLAPDKVHSCELVSGKWGTPGSVLLWRFLLDGKEVNAKEIIEEVDDELKKIVFKVIEGDVFAMYNPFIITLNAKRVDNKKLVIWTIESGKVNESVNDPTVFMDLLCAIIRDMDAHYLKQL